MNNDLINRQDAIEALGERPYNWCGTEAELQAVNDWELYKSAIESVPSAEPKHGEWIGEHKMPDMPRYEWYRCSECNFLSQNVVNYCPKCGARMKGTDDEYDK